MTPTLTGRRLPRAAAALLPVVAVCVVVFSLIAAMSGGTPTPAHEDRSKALGSLLTGRHTTGPQRLTEEHRPKAQVRPVQPATRRHTHRGGQVVHRTASAHDIALAPPTQLIANLIHGTKGYPGRHSLASNRRVPGTWYGHRSALPVVAATQDRLLVRLAQRPNGATTWIKRDKAVLRVTHWAIVIDVSRHFLYLFYNGVQQYGFPVGTGAPQTPTPTGEFFVAFHAASNGPGYGPINIATSAHSTVFRSFGGGDDAIIAIHGPIGSDAQIGNHGAAISNGCIRMHLHDLAKAVRRVPDGAPVVVTY